MEELTQTLFDAYNELDQLLRRTKAISKRVNVQLGTACQELEEFSSYMCDRFKRLYTTHYQRKDELLAEIAQLEARKAGKK